MPVHSALGPQVKSDSEARVLRAGEQTDTGLGSDVRGTADGTEAVSFGEEETYSTADIIFSQADKQKGGVPLFVFLDTRKS